jgi:uncharacterized membrane protein YagU involved in acid resistance
MNGWMKKASAGALAGIAAAFAMRQFVSWWHSATDQRVKDGAFGLDPEADINAAQRLWQALFQVSLNEPEALKIALAMHYGYSAAAGAGYAVLADKNPHVRSGYGTVYGTVLWLIGDELAITLMRLSDPRSKTAASHMAAFTAHLLFGIVIEFSRQNLLNNKA